MPVIQLTIDPTYCSDWTFWHGVREVIQNAKDAEDYLDKQMDVTHSSRTEKLTVTTSRTQIDTEALLLLGRSSKKGAGQRGQFGEGFILGMLALTRAGHPVTIYNGDEVWRPAIERAEEGPFQGTDLLVMKTRKLQSRREDFTVEIENVPLNVWLMVKPLFLFLDPPKPADEIRLSAGSVLLEEERKGKLYARGIFICSMADLDAGYDLTRITLDRDRRMVDEWDLKSALANLWVEAHAQEPEKLASRIYAMAKKGTPEVQHLQWKDDKTILETVKKQFHDEHGDDAVPVGDMTESRELDALGAKTAVVDRTLKSLLERVGPTLDVTREKFKEAIKASFAWADLSEEEQKVCQAVIEPINKAYSVVEFNNPSVAARKDGSGSGILIAREYLKGPVSQLTREVVRAEASHGKRTLEEIYLGLLYT